MKISIIGLGKLGSPMAAVMAHKGHTVVGVDVNAEFVKAIQEGRPPVREPQPTAQSFRSRRPSAADHSQIFRSMHRRTTAAFCAPPHSHESIVPTAEPLYML